MTSLSVKSSFAMASLSHKLICQLSFVHLSTDKQAFITALIAELPNEHQTAIKKFNHLSPNAVLTFADACTWADAIKHHKDFKQYKSWHYLNVERSDLAVTENSCKSDCITNAISIHTKQLLQNQNRWQTLQALMFIGHWLGDIHQPLHVSFASDLGGNRTKVKYAIQEKCRNLHHLWDGCLLAAKGQSQYSKDLYSSIYDELSQKWQVAPLKKWQNTSVTQWANESLAISRQAGVGYCVVNQDGVCQTLANKRQQLTQDYQDQYQPLLKERILQAAVRLHGILNTSLISTPNEETSKSFH